MNKKNSFPAFLAFVAYACLLGRDVGGGALRYYTDMLGVSWLWFIPDLAGFLFIIMMIGKGVLGQKTHLAITQPLFWGFYGLLGYMVSESSEATMSAFKMIMPFVFGIYAAAYREDLLRHRTLHWVFFGLSVAGVFMAQETVLPWSNYTIATSSIVREAANKRWIQNAEGLDVERLSGFASDSTSAGTVIAFCAAILMMYSKTAVRSVIFTVGLCGVYLTTSRTALLALIIAYLGFFFTDKKYKHLMNAALMASLIMAVCSFTLLPLIADNLNADSLPTALASMVDRLENTWVKPWAYVYDQYPWGLVTGLGLGPVGYPVNFSSYSFGQLEILDNFIFVNFLMFGVPGLIIGCKMLFDAKKIMPSPYIAMLIALILFGSTVQGYGAGIYCILIGLMLGKASHQTNIQNLPQKRKSS